MYKVLITAPYLIKEFDKYRIEFSKNKLEYVIANVNERLSENELLKYLSDVDGVICGDDEFSPEVIDSALKLKVIVKWGTGIDSIDKRYAEKRGIKVYNTPGAFTEPVSDTVMAYVLGFARKISEIDKKLKSKKWEKTELFSLSELSIGIIGIGNIGTAVARKAYAFGMKVFGNDIRKIDDKIIKKYKIEMVEINTLLRKSDFVSINCDLNSMSYHLIGLKELKLMKNSAYLINTARGPIVKEDDLVKALENNIISGAALDVFEKEPLPIESKLRLMNNVFLSPHNANSSPKFWQKVHKNSISLLIKGLKGGE